MSAAKQQADKIQELKNGASQMGLIWNTYQPGGIALAVQTLQGVNLRPGDITLKYRGLPVRINGILTTLGKRQVVFRGDLMMCEAFLVEYEDAQELLAEKEAAQ